MSEREILELYGPWFRHPDGRWVDWSEMPMKQFEISNEFSGFSFGLYPGKTKEEALDAMARDMGYSSYAAIPDEGGSHQTLLVTEIPENCTVDAAGVIHVHGVVHE